MILEWVIVIVAVLILMKLAYDYGSDKGYAIGYKEGTANGRTAHSLKSKEVDK